VVISVFFLYEFFWPHIGLQFYVLVLG
jgi:hypothetical protein